ncbi:hypothetical protein [Kitasatospora sp. NPDC085879]|uniref:hypothetical protein n=1 Tax=Kitasatospora sp. NPDC085879 TaxID=3154769 RepID=UPI0034448906
MNESIGYAKCSLDTHTRTARRSILLGLGVAEDRIYPSRVTVYRVLERARDMNAGVR